MNAGIDPTLLAFILIGTNSSCVHTNDKEYWKHRGDVCSTRCEEVTNSNGNNGDKDKHHEWINSSNGWLNI